jgi:hypothetical protein
MDGFKEKKWFAYLVDHHEGPFSLEEIQGKIAQGQLSGTSYVWADGMADWKMMTDVEVFDSMLTAGSDRTVPALTMPTLIRNEQLAPLATHSSTPVGGMALHTTEPTQAPATKSEAPHASALIVSASHDIENFSGGSQLLTSIPLDTPAYAGREMYQTRPVVITGSEEGSPSRSRLKKFLKVMFFLLILGGAAVAYIGGYLGPVLNSQVLRNGTQTLSTYADPLLITLTDKVPFLGQWISPIPQLQDVDKEEFELLKTAARAKLDVSPQLALALSRNDLVNPTIYASSNLPDGAIFDIYIEGIPETLLNQLSFSARGQVVISKRLGETSALKGLDGKIFPRGQYLVMAVDPDTQPGEIKSSISRFQAVPPESLPHDFPKDLKVVAMKSYFLGGPKDANYTTRLKEFHDKMADKARNEMNECKQFAATLEMQLSSTTQKFAFLHHGKRFTPAQAKVWGAFDRQWTALMDQLNQAFGKITPESVKNDYFYGALYQLSQQASQAVNKLHEIQNSVYTSTVDPKSAEIQLGEASAIAQTAVNELKAKIDYVDKLPPKPNGMPNRDGI